MVVVLVLYLALLLNFLATGLLALITLPFLFFWLDLIRSAFGIILSTGLDQVFE